MKKLLLIFVAIAALASCKNDDPVEEAEELFGDELSLDELQEIIGKDAILAIKSPVDSSAMAFDTAVPTTREELEQMKVAFTRYNGKTDFGIKIPGFGSLTLGKKQSNLNVYYLETKVVETDTDTVVYGIGYSVHYLFSKVKRGIDVNNLASVAASAQIQGSKTSVSYSLQSYGIRSNNLSNYFKPKVDGNFDVDGFGIIQSNLDGIHNILTDSILSSKTKFTPQKIRFVSPQELNY